MHSLQIQNHMPSKINLFYVNVQWIDMHSRIPNNSQCSTRIISTSHVNSHYALCVLYFKTVEIILYKLRWIDGQLLFSKNILCVHSLYFPLDPADWWHWDLVQERGVVSRAACRLFSHRHQRLGERCSSLLLSVHLFIRNHHARFPYITAVCSTEAEKDGVEQGKEFRRTKVVVESVESTLTSSQRQTGTTTKIWNHQPE